MSDLSIQIVCPSNFIPERKYSIDTLFNKFLGLDYELISSSTADHYEIKIDHSIIIVEDHFFQHQKEASGYLSYKNIPIDIANFSDKALGIEKLPVIYGLPEINIKKDQITCRIDLFASSFFMLTRWEEQVTLIKDQHGRFPATSSLAYKYKFLDRPVVNEYASLLLLMLQKLAPGFKPEVRFFECIPTHDVDHLLKWGSLSQIRKKLAHNFITQKKPLTGLKNAFDALKTRLHLKDDPYQTFEYIVNLSIKNNLTSHFYFMAGGNSSYDSNYDLEEAKPIIEYLQENNQVIGFHPSYNTLNNPAQWAEEKEALEQLTGHTIEEGRQHYLRFEASETWEAWDTQGLVTDSTLGYARFPGFRCGSCYPFHAFDFVNRQTLDLIENPLILMETTLITYMQLSPKEAYEVAKKLYFTVKKYNGNFTFLWHNSAMHTVEDRPYLPIYESIINGFSEDEE